MDSPPLSSSNVELDRLFGVRDGVVSAIDVQAALDKTCRIFSTPLGAINSTVCGQGNRSLVRHCQIGPPVPV